MRTFEESMKSNLNRFGYRQHTSAKVRAHKMDLATIINGLMMTNLVRFIQENEP